MPITSSVAPTTSKSLPYTIAVRPMAPVIPTLITPAPAAPVATLSNPQKPPSAVHSPQQIQMPSTGIMPSLSCAALAAPHSSA